MILYAVVILNMLLVLVVGLGLGLLRRKVAAIDHRTQAVLQRLSEGGVEIVEQVATEVRVPEPWRDLDGVADEDVEHNGTPERVNRETWLDSA